MTALPLFQGFIIGILAFAAEYMDSTLGMGYGTTLTPILLMMGFDPLQIVPAILLSELVTGFIAGFTHHSLGNMDVRPKTMNVAKIYRALRELGVLRSFDRGVPLHLKIVLLVGGCSVAGTVAAVVLALSLPARAVKLYIGVLVLVIGVVIVATRRLNLAFSWRRITALGFIASFNKGISGGGYGPVVMGGQLLAGVDARNAVGITSLAEALTCLVGVVLYVCMKPGIDWSLAPWLVVGGILSAPLSAFTVKAVRTASLRLVVGLVTIVLGIFAIAQAL